MYIDGTEIVFSSVVMLVSSFCVVWPLPLH